ncbi:MAG TPA: thiamine-phosphate kinase [Bryobacteraceae bacterium]|jgi:thiamine-monophosphate kinase|nr:thiamine-phosphate kinase [Bryobacteraceae bacterium]
MVKGNRNKVTEVDLVRHIGRWARSAPPSGSSLVRGIGDDCAIYRPAAREDLLFTTDLLIEDVHFRRSHKAEDVGWKCLTRGLSDIAAMGGEPRFCLVSLAAAPWTGADWIEHFYSGLLRLARRENTALAGGDLARGRKFTCDIVVCGAVPRGRALRRDGARAGDAIYVSGALGGSALGLANGTGAAVKRHLRPEPRLALGRFLRQTLHATAAMDLSDGLSLDLRRLCEASGLRAEIAPPPIFPGATLRQALHGGEDYELLFTVAPRTRVAAEFEGLPLTRIGVMRPGRADVLLDGAPLAPLGWDHFA